MQAIGEIVAGVEQQMLCGDCEVVPGGVFGGDPMPPWPNSRSIRYRSAMALAS